MSLTGRTIDSLQALLYTATVGKTLTGFSGLEDITTSMAHHPENPTSAGPSECIDGGISVVLASSVSTNNITGDANASVQWMMTHTFFVRMGVDVKGCRPEVLQVDLLSAFRQLMNLILAAVFPPGGTPRNMTGYSLSAPRRAQPDFYELEARLVFQEAWGWS